MEIYDVDVQRDGKWWMVEIPELDGVTQARRLSEVSLMACEWIALTRNLELGEVGVNIRSISTDSTDVLGRQSEIARLRDEIAGLEANIRELMRKTAWELTEQQVPARDIGYALGVSHQRVSQLVNE